MILSKKAIRSIVAVVVTLCHVALASYADSEFASADEFPEDRYLSSCNFWCQLKNSLGETIVGFLLICIAPYLIWKNEGRHVRELRRIDFCKNKAVMVSNVPLEENTNQLIHFSGTVSVGEAGLEFTPGTALNITRPIPKALLIKRTCYIYQKFEAPSQVDKEGRTTVTYREDWTPMGPQPGMQNLPQETNNRGIWDDLVTASGGVSKNVEPTGIPPNLPPQMGAMLQMADPTKAPNGFAASESAHVGGFGLEKSILIGEPLVFQMDWVPIPAEFVPDSVDGCEGLIKGSDGILRTNSENGQPSNGDVMVKYEYITDGFDCSFVVKQIIGSSNEADIEVGYKYAVSKAELIDDKCFGMIHDNLGVIWMMRRGKHDLNEMINMAKEEEKAITKVLRIVFYLVLVAGWIMIFSIFTTVISLLPLIGKLGAFAVAIVAFIVGTVCCGTVTSIAYIRYRPLIAVGIIVLSLGIWGIVAWRLDEAADSSVE